MEKPDSYMINSILNQFYYSAALIEENKQKDKTYNATEEKEQLQQLCEQMIYLVYNKKFTFGELFLADIFAKMVENGSFNAYDGQGDYIAFGGEELGPINWSRPYRYPKGTTFVAWYNK